MLSYFRAENYKCLELVEFPLTPIHVLIGPNDSGKTSVLEAMLIYMQSTFLDITVDKALPEGCEGKELVFHGAENYGKVSLTGMSDRSLAPKEAIAGVGPPWQLLGYGFSLSFPPSPPCVVSDECRIARRNLDGPRAGEHPEESKGHVNNEHFQFTTPVRTRAQGRKPEEELKLPRGIFGPATLYRFDPKVLAIPAVPDVNRKFRMDPDGFGLATLLDDLVGYDPELFLALRKEFCELFPQFKTVRVETAMAYYRQYGQQGVHSLLSQPHLPGKEVLFETQWGGIVRARQASEGVLLFLAFLALVYLPAAHRPKLVLLEEPERGVYPKKLEELIQALKKWVAANGESAPQIVMSTHSPYVISFFKPEEVTFLSRAKSGGVRARPLRDAPHINERLSGGFYLGELWYNLSEEELFGDARP